MDSREEQKKQTENKTVIAEPDQLSQASLDRLEKAEQKRQRRAAARRKETKAK